MSNEDSLPDLDKAEKAMCAPATTVSIDVNLPVQQWERSRETSGQTTTDFLRELRGQILKNLGPSWESDEGLYIQLKTRIHTGLPSSPQPDENIEPKVLNPLRQPDEDIEFDFLTWLLKDYPWLIMFACVAAYDIYGFLHSGHIFYWYDDVMVLMSPVGLLAYHMVRVPRHMNWFQKAFWGFNACFLLYYAVVVTLHIWTYYHR